ncbi:hypothetical protein AC1031_016505 [Aphanomyces cochlioides]|nr:hypothetical protein AC1031_016505 [Aphanomyces cochlioides]
MSSAAVSKKYQAGDPSRNRSQVTSAANRSQRMSAAHRIFVNLLTFNTVVTIVNATSMETYGQSCRVDASGFIPGTCSDVEIATTTKLAWISIGQRLSLQWLAESTSTYYVTTCIKSKPTNTGHIALVLLAGNDGFPQCQPLRGAQEIAGMAMVETTVRDEFQDGAYMLTVFADKTMASTPIHVNSDGSTNILIANINQTLMQRMDQQCRLD